MKIHTKTLLAAFAATATLGLMATHSVSADVIFVDASSTNTGPSSQFTSSKNSTDNLWQFRGFSIFNGGSAVEGYGATETLAELTTTVSVANGTYTVYGFFWDDSNGSYDVDLGLTSGSLTTYRGDTVSDASTLTFDSGSAPTLFTGSSGGRTQVMRYASLGQVTVSDGTLEVYIDSPSDNDNRTWYEGVGYELVPEPSSLALLGLGGLLVAGRRRRGDSI